MYDMTLFLALVLTQIKAHFDTPFGVAGRGKASLEIACIVHFVLTEPQ